MDITRRDFLKATSAVAAALGLRLPGAFGAGQTRNANDGPAVVWLQGGGCDGCSVSLLNSIHYMSVGDLLLNTINLKYHATLMAAAGADAVAAAQAAATQPGYVLVVEGSIPTAKAGRYCYLWPGLTALQGVEDFSQNAGFILAVGTCSAYGGVVGSGHNPTGVQPLQDILTGKQVINVPGCPSHPDWVVGTVAYLIAHGAAPELDAWGRPKDYFQEKVHAECPNLPDYDSQNFGLDACLYELGCKGKKTHADCPTRQWHSPEVGSFGINWCVGARSPCIGCTHHQFPDGPTAPFYDAVISAEDEPEVPGQQIPDGDPPPVEPPSDDLPSYEPPLKPGPGGKPKPKPKPKPETKPDFLPKPQGGQGAGNVEKGLTRYEKRRAYLKRKAEQESRQKRLEQERLENARRAAENTRKEYQRRMEEKHRAYQNRYKP